MKLTIGMATYQDYDGVYFTIQALRLYQDLEGVELLVVDNAGCERTRRFVEHHGKGRYIHSPEVVGTAAPRDRVFREARGQAVLCLDCHVLLAPGSVRRLIDYYDRHPQTMDLLQGPLLFDDLQSLYSHCEPVWDRQRLGVWASDERARDPDGEPFEIPMQGLGLFSCRAAAWPGFHPGFRGFGGVEGYIHEKFRHLGGKCLCLPWLRWVHRFKRSSEVPYPNRFQDRFRNYLLGHGELGLDPKPVIDQFRDCIRPAELQQIIAECLPQRPDPTGAEVPVDAPEATRPPAGAGATYTLPGAWADWYRDAGARAAYGSIATYERAAEFLADVNEIEDWGAGLGWFATHVRPDQVYRAIDGTPSRFADVVADLCEYQGQAEGILIRHVLEHNPRWEAILRNALTSFRKKLCVILFLPLGERTELLLEQTMPTGRLVPYFRLRREDFLKHFGGGLVWEEERVGRETIFYIRRRGA